MIGEVLGDRYELIEKIGEGGMAIVYKARDNKLSRLVAVKILKREFANNKDISDKFKKEATAVANFSDANIVNVLDVGHEEEGRNHPKKNVITRALGTNNIVKIDIFKYDLSSYDKYLLCTDGLSNEVLNEEILEEINKVNDYNHACDKLVLLAKSRGGRDNITVLLFGGEV